MIPAHVALSVLASPGGPLQTLRASRTRESGEDAVSWGPGPPIPAPYNWQPAGARWLERLPEAERARGAAVLRHRGPPILRASEGGLDSDAVLRGGRTWLARAESPWDDDGGYTEVLLTLAEPASQATG
jgi:hypothetical protein